MGGPLPEGLVMRPARYPPIGGFDVGVVSLRVMPDPKQIPELTTELFEMSKEYLLQETVEPAKKLGAYAGLGVAGALVFAVAVVLGMLGVYALFQTVLPETAWYNVLARGLTVVVGLAGAGLIAWRMSR